jgi:mersacidin/lichenicidin family type 2 lantibiotic
VKPAQLISTLKERNPMSELNVIRAWKDEEYRASLSAAERADAPPNPAGAIDVLSSVQNEVAGTGGSWFGAGISVDWMPCSVMICPTFLWQ